MTSTGVTSTCAALRRRPWWQSLFAETASPIASFRSSVWLIAVIGSIAPPNIPSATPPHQTVIRDPLQML